MRVLVAYGSKNGGTAGLAEMIGADLEADGLAVEVRPAAEVGDPARFGAVIVAGALYAFRWHRDARRFVRRHADELRQRPLWLVSSGPLDDSATEKDIPPVKGVRQLMEKAGARGHVTFGGRLTPDAKGLPARMMSRKLTGDWRDREQVEAWTREVARQLLARTVT